MAEKNVRIRLFKDNRHHARKAALDGLDLLEALDLESDVGQYPGDLFGPEIGVDVAFEPVIRNIHIVEFEN